MYFLLTPKYTQLSHYSFTGNHKNKQILTLSGFLIVLYKDYLI